MATIKDLQNVGDFTVTIDDQGFVTITSKDGKPIPAAFSAFDAYILRQFLENNHPYISHGMGVSRLGSQIRVWRPEKALELMPASYRYLISSLEKFAGMLFNYGSIWNELYQGGYTEEKSLFVLVPDDLYHCRARECLLQVAREQLTSERSTSLSQPPSEWQIGAFIEEVSYASEDDHDWEAQYARQAEEQARNVVYWLELAGSEPNIMDPNDARQK